MAAAALVDAGLDLRAWDNRVMAIDLNDEVGGGGASLLPLPLMLSERHPRFQLQQRQLQQEQQHQDEEAGGGQQQSAAVRHCHDD